ncbi:hypothetical protein DTW90_36610 [Neorhizobium sp. P12A]|uniref:SGNH/GDSL hydrolase family protein n=1 Tax=Neorhizobium sp. P12A TaxID=2268027 RepID=UPI0011EFB282|nr:SGNH/GDSL hydrolase family protein [Neorhizobium sp. P12A]KAA0683091.1 hypothetical protein DTW90_36610 [Neorhizobium sp. P12A]
MFQPLALGDTITFVGCSVEFDSNWYGYIPALLRKMNHRLQANPYGVLGFPGSLPDEFPVQLPAALAQKPAVLWIGDWVNATIPGTPPTLQALTDAVQSMMNQFAALPTSKLIILSPTRKATAGLPNISLFNAITAWCLAQDGKMIGNVKVKYLNAPYDISSGGADNADTRDQLHDNTRGAFFNRAKKFYDILAPILPAGRTLPTSGSPPSGNLTSNPNFSGTGGGKSGAGAANISGTIADGYTLMNGVASGVNIVADASGGRQRFTLSGNQPATADIYLQVNVPGLTRGKKYIGYVGYKVSKADGVSAATSFRNLSILGGAQLGSDGRGALISGYGDVPTPYRDGNFPLNPETGIAEDIGEAWMVTHPTVSPITGSTTTRIYLTPFVGAVDIMLDFTDFFVVEFHDKKGLPYYQNQLYTRPSDGSTMRFFQSTLGPYTVGGIFPTFNSTTKLYSYTAAQANASWIFQPGDWSGDPDSYDGVVSVSTDGGTTYNVVVASLASANWTWNAASAGLVAGNKVKIDVTATSTGFGSTTASEVISIT